MRPARAALLASWLATAGCGGERPDAITTGARVEAVTKGTAASNQPSIVALVATPLSCGPPTTTATCTGTVVAPRAVLTAGHCADETVAYVVEQGDVVGAPTNARRRVIKAVKHPQYQRDTSDFDLAILWLDAPLGDAPQPALGAISAPAPGEVLRLVGFGQTRDATQPEGTRREGTVNLTSVTAHTFEYGASPSMSCQGDSGGPLWWKGPAGDALVGVISAGDKNCNKSGVAARVDAALADFLSPTLAQPPPAGVAGVELSCDGVCVRDQDCRPGLVCRQARDGENRCALSGFEPGVLTTACKLDAECRNGASCATTYDGCQCYEVCAGPPDPVVVGPDPKSTAQPPAGAPGELEGGCGIAHRRGASVSWGALLSASVAALGLRGARRRRR